MLMPFWSYSHWKVNNEIRLAGINIFVMCLSSSTMQSFRSNSVCPRLSRIQVLLGYSKSFCTHTRTRTHTHTRTGTYTCASTLKGPTDSSGDKYVQSGSHKITVFLVSETVVMVTSRLHLSTAFRILTIGKGTMKEFQLGQTLIYLRQQTFFLKKCVKIIWSNVTSKIKMCLVRGDALKKTLSKYEKQTQTGKREIIYASFSTSYAWQSSWDRCAQAEHNACDTMPFKDNYLAKMG